jgi:hypothetical protein
MAGGGDSGHTDGIMNLISLPTVLLALPAETGGIFLTMLFITMTVAFPLRMERRRK